MKIKSNPQHLRYLFNKIRTEYRAVYFESLSSCLVDDGGDGVIPVCKRTF